MISLLNYQGMKSCKSRESFCLSIPIIYTNDCSTFGHAYWCHVYFLLCEIPQYVQTKNRLAHLHLDFMKMRWQACWAVWRWWMQADLVPSDQKYSHKWNLSFFKAVPSNRLSFYLAPALYNQNAILHKMLKLGFLNFKPIFLRMQFPLVATFFSLVLVISLSWYFHLTISHQNLVSWLFESQMVFPNI